MMRILDVPDVLRARQVPYPWHMRCGNSEETFYRFAVEHAAEINTALIYIPIFWWNNSYWQTCDGGRIGDFYPVPAAQYVLDSLNPSETYFTISNCDDGIYEDLPDNVVVFNAGGYGDIPIPLLGDEWEPLQSGGKQWLASFTGTIECGGPVDPAGKRRQSSWDKNGVGASLRRRMRDAFAGRKDCLIETPHGKLPSRVERFKQTAAMSRFVLAPRGYGRTSYRLYEMFDLGVVPVYIYDDHGPWLPWWDQLDWSEFAVLCHIRHIESLPDRLEAISEDMRQKMLRAARFWHASHFTRAGMCHRIEECLELWK